MDDDTDIPEEMVEDLGIAPGAAVDDRQRFELLREWHRRDAQREEEEKNEKGPR